MSNTDGFKLATLAASIALAMASTAALAAAPTATQLPGASAVTVGSATGGTITSGAQTITLGGNTVINWGAASGATINASSQPGGFNIGSGASLTFAGTGGVLNVDVSGNASQIFGSLSSSAGNLFVANANGIIVGPTATISSTAGDVGLIANTLGGTSGFDGTIASFGYNGTGGNVTVQTGATIGGATVLVSGGGTVNVDLGKIATNALVLVAGLPNDVGYDTTANNFTVSGFETINPNAALNVTGSLPAGSSFGLASGLASGGDITTSGTVDVTNAAGGATAGGTLTNNGTLTWGLAGSSTPGNVVNNGTINLTGTPDIGGSLTNYGQITGAGHVILASGVDNSGSIDVNIIQSTGDFTNSGEITVGTAGPYPAAITVIGGNLSNSGQLASAGGVSVTGGDFSNTGAMTLSGTGNVTVMNGSASNGGQLSVGGGILQTMSDDTATGYSKGADYSITNTGTITGGNSLYLNANDDYEGGRGGTAANDSTGSVSSTGVLQVGAAGSLYVEAHNDANLGGSVQVYDGTKYVATSATNPLGYLEVNAADWDTSGAFETTGVATLATDVTLNSNAWLGGYQINLMSNVSTVDSTGNPIGYIDIIGGAAQDSGYAVRVASGKTISADKIYVDGDQAGDNPNVILQGTLAANSIEFGDSVAVGDVFSGANGGLQMWNDGSDPYLYINSTGRVKTAPYLNDANFRYNYLPVDVTDGSPLTLEINADSLQGTPTSGYNLLVNSDVTLGSDWSGPAPIYGTGSAVTGVTNVPNSHLVLQSTGNIDVGNGGDFYWPGYIYLGNIGKDADGNALPGTLGLGTITTDGNVSNVLPGDIAGASGIHFITQFPMTLGGSVTTNANAWVNFGTDLLTQAYAGGTLGNGLFYGGTQGSGNVVNYGALDASNFVTQAPSATP